MSRKLRPRKRRLQTSETQISKRKRKGKDELRAFNSLRSRAKAVFVFVPCLFYGSLFARSAFSRSVFSRTRKRRPRKRRRCKQRPIKHRHGTNTKTAFSPERNEFKSLSWSFLFLFEVCGLRFRGLRFRDTHLIGYQLIMYLMPKRFPLKQRKCKKEKKSSSFQ